MAELMGIFQASDLQDLKTFPARQDQLAILERQTPAEAQDFFDELMVTPFGIAGKVTKKMPVEDIRHILDDEIPQNLQGHPFFQSWVSDMAEVCSSFSDTINEDSLTFWLGSQRGCSRYHIDNVPLRALVTYAGTGTEWLPDEAADRQAFHDRKPNEDIVKDASAVRFMKAWDVAVFRGGPEGLLHRTPDSALSSPSSILMRLDHPSFWDNILKHTQEHHHE